MSFRYTKALTKPNKHSHLHKKGAVGRYRWTKFYGTNRVHIRDAKTGEFLFGLIVHGANKYETN